jgi:hypothetical protein
LERRVAGLVPEDKRRPAEPVALQEADTRVVGRPGRMIADSRCSAPVESRRNPARKLRALGQRGRPKSYQGTISSWVPMEGILPTSGAFAVEATEAR